MKRIGPLCLATLLLAPFGAFTCLAVTVTETFDSYADGTVITNIGGGGVWTIGTNTVVSGGGVNGTDGLSTGSPIFNWKEQLFQWSTLVVGTKVAMSLDFQSSATGKFDDDRVGWTIDADNSGSSTHQLALQLDNVDETGMVVYWNATRTQLNALAGIKNSTWYRFKVEFTKLGATNASIVGTLTELDATGHPTGTPYVGTVANTATFVNPPEAARFTSSFQWPSFKNLNAADGNADNATFTMTPPLPYRSYTGTPVTESFDGLGTTGTDITLLTGWNAGHFSTNPQQGTNGGEGLATVTDALVVDNGSHDTAGTPMLANFGTTGASDRALGSFARTTPAGDQFLQLAIKNDSGVPITAFVLTYTGEQWRSSSTPVQPLTVWYSGTSASSGFVSMGSALTFNSPNVSGTGQIDGNAAANRTVISATYVPAAPIAAGSTFYVRWYDINENGATDDFLAIDDLTVTPFSGPLPPMVTLSLTDSPMVEAGGEATVTATLSEPSASDVTVNLAFSGTATLTNDYTRSGDSILIPAGDLSNSITLTAVQDTVYESPAEIIVVDIDTVDNAIESGTQQVTATITDDDPAPAGGGFTAYNDCSSSTNSPANTTQYRGNGTTSGQLKDFTAGTNLPVALAITANAVTYDGSGGPMPNVGTDAYDTFNGKVVFDDVVWYTAASNGFWMDATFTGLDPAKEYEFATSVNRGGSGTDYGNRFSKFTISDIDSATNASTLGVTVNSATSVTFCSGSNSVNGYVARWTRIKCGSDGDFKVRVEDGGGVGKGYAFDGVMLRETRPAGPQPLAVSITSPANNATVGTSFTISATATGDAAVTNVYFYNGATLLGNDASSPYTYTWNSAPLGAHALKAVAWDNTGLAATSAVVNVTVITMSGTTVTETFDSYANGMVITNIGGGGVWTSGTNTVLSTGGVNGSGGVSFGSWIFNWKAQTFQWSTLPDGTKVAMSLDFQSSPTGKFDDDRVGWTITPDASTSTGSQLALQLDNTTEGGMVFYHNLTRTPVLNALSGIKNSTWYRFNVEFTKLGVTNASIVGTLTELDASGNPTGAPFVGTITNTATFANPPSNTLFTATQQCPSFKNHNPAAGNVDNATFTITPPATPTVAQYVIVISVDGLGGTYLNKIFDGTATGGPYAIPNFTRLKNEGAGTLAAHCDNDNWETLPNHTSMMTGRPQAGANGHNWIKNTDPAVGETIHSVKGSYVASGFDVAHDNGLRTGMYANKSKFSLFDTYNSYTGGGSYNATYGLPDTITPPDNGQDKIDNTYINTALGGIVVDTFIAQQQSASSNQYVFVHINEPDSAGHGSGWGSATWNSQVVVVDTMLGKIFKLIEQDVPAMIGKTAIILTADHGNQDNPPTGADRYAVPFYVWGPGVAAGADLYTLNASTRQVASSYPMTTYGGMQPIRNAEASNLALDLLGLGAIPGSTFDSAQDLVVTGTPSTAFSTTAISSSRNPSAAGSNVTFTVTVAPVAPATITPTGSVQFLTNGVALGSPVSLVAGVATRSTALLRLGTNTVAANYLGDGNYQGSSSSLAQVVTAVFVPSAPGIIGNTNEATLTDGLWFNGDYINASRFQATSNMTVATMHAKVTAITGKYKCAIYSESNSLPSRLLRSTTEVTNPATGWQTFTLTAPQTLTNGSSYWLAIWSDADNAQVYCTTNGGTLRWALTNYATAWPNPIATATVGSDYKYCIYAKGAPVTLVSIAVTPTNPNCVTKATLQFTATGTYSDGSTPNLTSQVTWNSSRPAGATINVSGLATAVAVGTSTISATYGSVSGNSLLTVQPAPLTITANSGQSKVFGAADPTLTYVSSDLTVAFTGALSRVAGTNVGAYAITQGNLSAGTNYSITFVPANFAITAKPVTVTANPGQSKVFGASDPVLTYVSSDPGATFSGALGRASGEAVASYAINQGGLSAGANYSITFVPANFAITPASSTTEISSSLNPSAAGSNVTFTVTVAPVAPATTTPTGNVQFLTNGVAAGSPVPLVTGVATLSTALLPSGTNTVTANYLGEGNYLDSSNSLLQVVSAGVATPSVLGIVRNGNGSVTITFTGTPGAQYLVLATTNFALPGSWVNVSTNNADLITGQWTYIENTMTNYTKRLFRAAKP
jgi:hypothetical protein